MPSPYINPTKSAGRPSPRLLQPCAALLQKPRAFTHGYSAIPLEMEPSILLRLLSQPDFAMPAHGIALSNKFQASGSTKSAIWTALKSNRPCGTGFAIGPHAHTRASSAQPCTARLKQSPSFDSLFPRFLGSAKTSCAVQIGQLKNLTWTCQGLNQQICLLVQPHESNNLAHIGSRRAKL